MLTPTPLHLHCTSHDDRHRASLNTGLRTGFCAVVLTATVNGWAQTAPQNALRESTLKTVTVKEAAQAPEGKDAIRATQTGIGKGTQALRDIPQSVTVVTEKLIDDRNLDTLKDVLHNTAGVTFQAAEGGEEDIRLRGFSLAATGDLFVDGMRDPAFYDRDTFNYDRVELLRGSASMLFGRGSTGGAVNQVSKLPRLITEHEVNATASSHNGRRITGDFNLKTGDDAALRINAMAHTADNNGAGSSIDKRGLAAAYRFGIGTQDEFLASLFALDNHNGINYGIPWIRPTATASAVTNTLLGGKDPTTYYGLASDRNQGTAQMATLKHTHRFNRDAELQTQVRSGTFSRDLRASAIRFAAVPGNSAAVGLDNLSPSTVLTRGTNNKIQDVQTLHAQSDLSVQLQAWGAKHELLTGIDFAREKKIVFAARTAAQGGIDVVKPNTTLSTPSDGASVNEAARVLVPGNEFVSHAVGLYGQDLMHLNAHWKLLAGLRYDHMRGEYSAFSLPAASAGPVTALNYAQKIAAFSKRAGLLYQPTALDSFHLSYGTSFNTSGDAYSYNAQSANTPPESSQNLELGGKFDSTNKRFTTRFAVFRSSKLNERNTDPDTAATRLLLSGKRHSAGVEVDFTGMLTRQWEVYGSYMWMPVAVVDVAASTATTVGNRVGDRPGLSPRHNGTVWNTYQVAPKWRLGGGVNFRDRQAPADATAPAWEAPAYLTADLMAEYRLSEQFAFKANLNNVANKLYADSLYRAHYVPGAGRMLSLSISAKF